MKFLVLFFITILINDSLSFFIGKPDWFKNVLEKSENEFNQIGDEFKPTPNMTKKEILFKQVKQDTKRERPPNKSKIVQPLSQIIGKTQELIFRISKFKQNKIIPALEKNLKDLLEEKKYSNDQASDKIINFFMRFGK